MDFSMWETWEAYGDLWTIMQSKTNQWTKMWVIWSETVGFVVCRSEKYDDPTVSCTGLSGWEIPKYSEGKQIMWANVCFGKSGERVTLFSIDCLFCVYSVFSNISLVNVPVSDLHILLWTIKVWRFDCESCLSRFSLILDYCCIVLRPLDRIKCMLVLAVLVEVFISFTLVKVHKYNQ